MQNMYQRNTTAVRAAFSMMEIIVAIVLIGLLLAVIGTRFIGFGETGREKLVPTQMKQLKGAIDLYNMNMGQYPEDLDDLVERPDDEKLAKRWTQSLKKVPTNPWGIEYEYTRLAEPGKAVQGHPYELTTTNKDESKTFDVWDYE